MSLANVCKINRPVPQVHELQASVEDATAPLFVLFGITDADARAAKLAELLPGVKAWCHRFDSQLSHHHGHIAGNALSVADIVLVCWFSWLNSGVECK